MAISVAPRGIYLNCAIKFGLWDGDTPPTHYYDPVNFTKLELTGQVQEADNLISNIDGTIGEALISVQKPTEPASMEAEANYMPPALWQLVFGADITELNQAASGPVARTGLTLVQGLWTPLPDQYLAAHSGGTPIIAQTTADATVAAEHYEIDHINGLIKALTATGVTITKLSYFLAARTGEIYAAGKAKSAFVRMTGAGTERGTQRKVRIIVEKASLSAASANDLVIGSYFSGALSGNLLTPPGASSPWTYVYTDQSA